ncbi:MAG: amino acid transporter [Actinomycetota bacterium]|nr:MAG: amino acid transporter [Actinomycetota bacterium]
MATQDVFIRKSSGLTRQISARDALMYCAMNPGLLYALVYIVWAPAFFPGAHMGIGVLFVLLIFPIAGLYWYFSVSMPRSGGEYVYISRTLHPALGLFSCFVLSITALSWTGQIQDWWIRWGLADAIRAVGISSGNQGWIDLANTIDLPIVRFLLGTVALLLTGWLFLKGAKAMMRVSYWAVAFAWLAVLILGILLVVTGQDGFKENFNRLSGAEYDAILEAGREAGAVFGISFLPLMYAAVTYINLNTLGQTFSANLAGEIRGVARSQALALFGSLAMQMTIWFCLYMLVYGIVGTNFMHSLASIWASDASQLPPALVHEHTTSEPVPMLLVAFMTGNPILQLLFGLCFIVATWVSLAGLGFAPIRNVFAWSFDRLIPTSFSEIKTKYRAPVWAIVAVIAVAEVFLWLGIYSPAYSSAILYSIVAWFIGWIVLGIAGIVYPYRRKELFEAGPPATQRRIAGIPVISILGFLTLAVSIFTEWAVAQPFFKGEAEANQYLTVAAMCAIPLVIYAIAHVYHTRKGIPLKVQFSQVPPE